MRNNARTSPSYIAYKSIFWAKLKKYAGGKLLDKVVHPITQLNHPLRGACNLKFNTLTQFMQKSPALSGRTLSLSLDCKRHYRSSVSRK